jgi:hypothetical protein
MGSDAGGGLAERGIEGKGYIVGDSCDSVWGGKQILY